MAIVQIKKISTDQTNLGASNYFNRYWKDLDFDYLKNRIANSYDIELNIVSNSDNDKNIDSSVNKNTESLDNELESNSIEDEMNSDSDIALGRIRTWYRGRELAGFSDNIDKYNEFKKIAIRNSEE